MTGDKRFLRAAIACWLVGLALLVGAVESFGQAGGQLPWLNENMLNATGVLLPGGKLCSYAAGTTTPLATYGDKDLGALNVNPLVMNSAGRPSVDIYLDAVSYKFALRTAGTDGTCSTGTVVWTRDNVYDKAALYRATFATKLDDKVCHASQYTGTTPNDAGGKIAACVAALPSTGGTVDTSGLEGAQTISTDIWSGVTKSVNLRLAAGQFTVTATQTMNCTGCSIEGLNVQATQLKFSGVSKGLSIKKADHVTNLTIDGAATTNAKGVVAGDGTTWGGYMSGVSILNFGGATGIGLQLGDIVRATFTHNFIAGNGTNVLVEGVSSGVYPTTITFVSNRIESASVGKGMKVTTCANSHFIDTIFESNLQEGLYITSNAAGIVGDVTDCDFYGSHFEDNNGNNAANYQLMVLAANTRTIRFRLQDSYFNPTGATKSVEFDGTNGFIAGVVLDNNQMPNTAQVLVVNAGTTYGTVTNFPRNLTYATVVTDAGSLLRNIEDLYTTNVTNNILTAWTTWTPTYSSNLGNAATTFSGAVSTEIAKYKQVGKTLYMELGFNGTLNAVTPSVLRFTFPNSLIPDASDKVTTAAEIGDNGVAGNGWVQMLASGTYGQCTKSTGANFTVSSLVSCRFTAVIEVQ